MRRAGWLVFVMLLFVAPKTATGTPPCPSYDQALLKATVAVTATTVWRPTTAISLLRVDQYHRGLGRRYIFVTKRAMPYEPRSPKPRSPGPAAPVLLGLKQDRSGYFMEWCDLVAPTDQVQKLNLPPGQPPLPGIDLQNAAFQAWALPWGLGGILLAFLAAWKWRQRRVRTGT